MFHVGVSGFWVKFGVSVRVCLFPCCWSSWTSGREHLHSYCVFQVIEYTWSCIVPVSWSIVQFVLWPPSSCCWAKWWPGCQSVWWMECLLGNSGIVPWPRWWQGFPTCRHCNCFQLLMYFCWYSWSQHPSLVHFSELGQPLDLESLHQFIIWRAWSSLVSQVQVLLPVGISGIWMYPSVFLPTQMVHSFWAVDWFSNSDVHLVTNELCFKLLYSDILATYLYVHIHGLEILMNLKFL